MVCTVCGTVCSMLLQRPRPRLHPSFPSGVSLMHLTLLSLFWSAVKSEYQQTGATGGGGCWCALLLTPACSVWGMEGGGGGGRGDMRRGREWFTNLPMC